MNLDSFKLDELLFTAIKSEIDSNKLYRKIAKKTRNGLLQDKLEFLAKEEKKHQEFIEDIYKNHYPEEKIKLPNETIVPMPKIEFDEEMPVSKLLGMAMKAEEKSSDFYKSLAGRFESGSKIHNTLLYFADMETGHYKILEIEKESMERFEEADVYWPMMHIGP